jgi:hypothetical protein
MTFFGLFDFRRTTNRTEYKTVDLETFEERRTRWRSIRIIYLTMFVMSTGFTIILTGVWPYLKKVEALLIYFPLAAGDTMLKKHAFLSKA